MLWEQILSFKSSACFRSNTKESFSRFFLDLGKIIAFYLSHWRRCPRIPQSGSTACPRRRKSREKRWGTNMFEFRGCRRGISRNPLWLKLSFSWEIFDKFDKCSTTNFRGDSSWNIFYGHLSPSGSCQFRAKESTQVLVNRWQD